jgi:hypothetical protein
MSAGMVSKDPFECIAGQDFKVGEKAGLTPPSSLRRSRDWSSSAHPFADAFRNHFAQEQLEAPKYEESSDAHHKCFTDAGYDKAGHGIQCAFLYWRH